MSFKSKDLMVAVMRSRQGMEFADDCPNSGAPTHPLDFDDCPNSGAPTHPLDDCPNSGPPTHLLLDAVEGRPEMPLALLQAQLRSALAA